MSDTVKGAKRANSGNTPTNAISFLVEREVKRRMNTAEIMRVDGSDPQDNSSTGGRLKATPMVKQVDGFDQAIDVTKMPNMPFYRPQAGKAAIIMEPQPGDKAIAIFTKRDSSNLEVGKNDPVQPGSHRNFDQADGFLINGFLGVKPEIWLMLDPASGNIELSTKSANVEISCRDGGDLDIKTGSGNISITCTEAATITAENATIDAPQTTITGDAVIKGSLAVEGETTGAGGGPAIFRNGIINRQNGILNQAGGITDEDVTVKTHLHSGVQPGGGDTAKPVAGT